MYKILFIGHISLLGALEIATMLRLGGARRPKIVSNVTTKNNQHPLKQSAIAPIA